MHGQCAHDFQRLTKLESKLNAGNLSINEIVDFPDEVIHFIPLYQKDLLMWQSLHPKEEMRANCFLGLDNRRR